ncbi:MAG: hypothetical protein J0I96_03480 [Rhodanobacter sp.]|nr:hypothetical protein [Rhodanobacter sp.]
MLSWISFAVVNDRGVKRAAVPGFTFAIFPVAGSNGQPSMAALSTWLCDHPDREIKRAAIHGCTLNNQLLNLLFP